MEHRLCTSGYSTLANPGRGLPLRYLAPPSARKIPDVRGPKESDTNGTDMAMTLFHTVFKDLIIPVGTPVSIRSPNQAFCGSSRASMLVLYSPRSISHTCGSWDAVPACQPCSRVVMPLIRARCHVPHDGPSVSPQHSLDYLALDARSSVSSSITTPRHSRCSRRFRSLLPCVMQGPRPSSQHCQPHEQPAGFPDRYPPAHVRLCD